ncbi:MAG: GlsB/YeaQ/YmgE family stress response membrane protein [Anaerolineae bacterium]|nr:GlsB/YeaQ/YmgE family stress response membrane protein [Anaerolineae bacterium]
MSILAWIVVGLVAGWAAGMTIKKGGYGVIGDIIVGVVGAVLGGFLTILLFGGQDAVNDINLASIVIAVLGAVILIAVGRALPGRAPV